jgi:hypothetical protein
MAFPNQIANRNFLSPIGFKFILSKYPKVDFFSNKANIPGITLGVAVQPTYLKDIPVPGDKLEYDDLSLTFIVDENMENYLAIYDWMVALGYPENVSQFNELRLEDRYYPADSSKDMYNQYSDGVLQILNSNYQPKFQVKFKDLFPVSLTTLEFDATNTDYSYFSATVTFKYTIFQMKTIGGAIL